MHYALINHVSQRGGSSSLLHYTRRSGRYATDCASTPLTDTHARPLPGQPLHLLSRNPPLLLHYYGQLDSKAPGTSALTNHAVPAPLYFWYRVCSLISGPRIAQFQCMGIVQFQHHGQRQSRAPVDFTLQILRIPSNRTFPNSVHSPLVCHQLSSDGNRTRFLSKFSWRVNPGN